MRTPLSVLYLTKNEAHNLKDSLLSLDGLADDVVVVDSGSTDQTVAIAKTLGCRVFERPLDNWGEQRNWGIDQCKHPWVLVLDADERLGEVLLQSLREWKAQDHGDDEVFAVKRRNYFRGQAMRFSGLQSDVVNRLFHRSKRYVELAVHEKLDAPIGTLLKGELDHYTYKNERAWEDKMHLYARRSAVDHLPKTPKITLWHTVVKPAFRFFKHYVLRGGFLDGAAGWHYSRWMARGVSLRYSYMKLIKQP
ncbi:MAG: hypothetical protein RL754_1201 [Bacteroidota bacterium]|jgi:glycosyltransferase involved in cell wall biosynthesis